MMDGKNIPQKRKHSTDEDNVKRKRQNNETWKVKNLLEKFKGIGLKVKGILSDIWGLKI